MDRYNPSAYFGEGLAFGGELHAAAKAGEGRMNYQDSVEKSAEYLRLALPWMVKQQAAVHPISYAIWYEYVAERNAALKAAIDDYLTNGRVLDEKATCEIFQKHIVDLNVQAAQRLSEGYEKAMADMSSSAAQAGDQAGQFGGALERFCTDRVSSDTGIDQGIDTILGLAREMQNSVISLVGRLDESRREIEELRQEVMRARDEALTDGLTGLINRRGFDKTIAACLDASRTSECPPSLLMADIDHFKQVNDTYGHLFGDRVIKAVAQILTNNVKGKDTAARYGGEEFVVLLPDTPVDGALQLAENIRSIVERCRIKRINDNGAVGSIRISLGVTSFKPGESAADFVARADAAMYVSKKEGRNRVTLAQV